MNEPFPPIPDPEPWRPGYERFPQLAGYGQRFLGRLLDDIILIAPVMLWAYVLRDPGASAATSQIFFYLLVLAFSFANDVALTASTGRSIGKMITGTRVVRVEDWGPIAMGNAMTRWVVMVVLGVVPFGFIVDGIFIFSGELRQTLHDKAASTTVVRVTL